jgi:hypothetical protein
LWNILQIKKRKFLGNDDFDFHDKKKVSIFKLIKEGEWLVEMLLKNSVSNAKIYTFQEIKADFESIWKTLNYFGTQNQLKS